MAKPKAQKILRIVLACIFLVAAIGKLLDPYPFGDFLNSIRILSGNLIIPTVYILSSLELVLSLFLIFNFQSKVVSMLLIGVILASTLYSIWLYISGVSLTCGCFGGFLDREIGAIYFLTNGFIILGFLIYLWLEKDMVNTPSQESF